MRLNLNQIIEIPGSSLPYKCELDSQRLIGSSVVGFEQTPYAEGQIKNTAGALTLTGNIYADMLCVCDRCMGEYRDEKVMPVEAHLSAELQDDDNPDIFPLDADGYIDLSDLLETCFIFDMEAKSLCKPDCAGLCETCGVNLNHGKCSCQAPSDPRLAVLAQLLDLDE